MILDRILNDIKNNIKHLSYLKNELQCYIIKKDDCLYFHNLKDENILTQEDLFYIERIFTIIKYRKYGNTIVFNINNFYKEYINLRKIMIEYDNQ